jgi:hypothetical protein
MGRLLNPAVSDDDFLGLIGCAFDDPTFERLVDGLRAIVEEYVVTPVAFDPLLIPRDSEGDQGLWFLQGSAHPQKPPLVGFDLPSLVALQSLYRRQTLPMLGQELRTLDFPALLGDPMTGWHWYILEPPEVDMRDAWLMAALASVRAVPLTPDVPSSPPDDVATT